MATSAINSTIKRTTPPAKSIESGDDSSFSTRRSAPRRYRSLSRFSHRMPDPDAEVTPMRKGKFVNTVRGSGFAEISLDDLAVEFFDSFSAESGVSSGERGRSGSRKPGNSEGELTHSQRRGRSVSRVGPVGNGGSRRLDADTESSRRRRSLSRQPTARGNTGNRGGSVKVDPESNNSSRRRSVSRQPRERVNAENSGNTVRGRAIGEERENVNSRRRRSLSVVRRRIDNSELQSDVDQVQCSRDGKSFMGGKSHIQGLRRSFSKDPIKYHDGYSSHSSAVTDDEGKDYSSSKHGAERIIRTVYAQNKATPKKRESFGNSDYGSQQKAHDGISIINKGYATKLQEFEERKLDLLAEIMLEQQHGRELSTENSSQANKKPSRMRKRSMDRSSRMSMCVTDEAEQYIDEFISNIEDTDFSSLEDERSESSSSICLTKPQSTQSVPVEMDGVMLPWLQWETPDDTLACLNTPITKPYVWESDPAQGASSIGTISSRGSWSPFDSAKTPVNPLRRLKIDVVDYLKRPNNADILNETWKLRHRISSGSLVLSSRSLI